VDLAKSADVDFIKMILNSSILNRVGLVGYATSAPDTTYHNLSSNNNSLIAEVNSWSASGSTCICCGINRAVDSLMSQSNSSKYRSVVVMSDGEANVLCARQGTGNAKQDAIDAACDAHEIYNLSVYAIGFGNNADEVTLQSIADCGNGSYFYSSVDQLSEIYKQVAENILSTYQEQTINTEQRINTRLYDDSYIEFNYTAEDSPYGLVIDSEKKFDSSSGGSFLVPVGSRVLELKVASYSGSRWTDRVLLDGGEVYKLSGYGLNYILLGDPFIVDLPISLASGTHIINLTTGVSAQNSTVGSAENKIIAKFVYNSTSYSPILDYADGCNWVIEFDDLTNMSVKVPTNYTGSEACYYDSAHGGTIENEYDSAQVCVLNLLKTMDFDGDSRLDVNFDEQSLRISTTNIEGIPIVWSTEVQVRTWD
jgi:hypothetical protein